MINNEKLFDYLINETTKKFRGWDFSYLSQTNRMEEFPLPWNYRNEVIKKLLNVNSLLDMGTGGGEFLSSLPFPKNTCATEGYKPNIQIASEFLSPMGIHVYGYEDDRNLPFDNNQFALIINRHESFDPKEVYRILSPNGFFITQQVGGRNDYELNELFETHQSIYSDWSLNQALNGLKKANFNINHKNEAFSKTRFYDIGAIIYYLKAIPWQIPDFTIDKYKTQLIKIHNLIQDKGFIDITCHRFIIIATK